MNVKLRHKLPLMSSQQVTSGGSVSVVDTEPDALKETPLKPDKPALEQPTEADEEAYDI